MSGFDRMLGALSARDMLECARGLLRFLAGEAGGSAAAPAASGGGGGEAGRAGGREDLPGGEAGEFGGVRELAAAGRGGREVRRSRGGERARRENFDGGGDARKAREDAGALDGADRRAREAFRLPRGSEDAERGEPDGPGGAGAAFAGPERRYDNAVGARGMEMSRVSDYFKRDSRRYDTGYTRF